VISPSNAGHSGVFLIRLIGSTGPGNQLFHFSQRSRVMFANGFKGRMISGLIRTGLATAERETKAGSQPVGRVQITEAGRRALED